MVRSTLNAASKPAAAVVCRVEAEATGLQCASVAPAEVGHESSQGCGRGGFREGMREDSRNGGREGRN